MQMLDMNAINISDDFDCKVCNLFKLTRKVNRETQKRTSRRLEKIHTDAWNSYKTFNIEDNKYFVFLIDDLTRKSWIVLMKFKTKISAKIREWHAFVSLKTKKKTVIFKIDNVKKYQKFDRTTQFDDVYMKFITAYISDENGVAEKYNRTIVQMTRSMLIWAELSQRF